ncbi:SET domain-containing protein [Paraburkholderia kururiensis]|uniref:SET domain-containing protein n=1 Tax=Paraburkholderia kururiensis TaxID=984307 RepID=A0ABZ0WV68_9BURK|nr:SET domain-containing protein [Paraburkholderia kururiensis]WQD81236.1 SET domain-containing protein [Paraburkholderia kururiensis]
MQIPVSSRPSSRNISVRRSPIHGKGVFALRALDVGEIICEYKGKRIAWDEATRRPPRDPSQPNHTFYFDLGNGQVIDGAMGGNSARWINHSCAPNCEAEDHNGRIYIRAICDIAAGEELGLDYALIVEERHTPRLLREYLCRCGASTCRGTMLAVRRKRAAVLANDGQVSVRPADQAGNEGACRGCPESRR